mgnify:FL=1
MKDTSRVLFCVVVLIRDKNKSFSNILLFSLTLSIISVQDGVVLIVVSPKARGGFGGIDDAAVPEIRHVGVGVFYNGCQQGILIK